MKKLNNFHNALKTLHRYSEIQFDDYSTVEKDLMITGYLNHFEKTFELSWKLSKEILQYEGVSEAANGSPLAILRLAYRYDIIADEALWKEALNDRNELSHRYDPEEINAMALKVTAKYTTMFDSIAATIDKRVALLYYNGLIPKSEIDDHLKDVVSNTEEFEAEQ